MTDETQVTPPAGDAPATGTETKAKSNSVVTTEWDKEKRQLRFNVLKASPTGGSMTLILEMDKIAPSNRDYAAVHGFKQRVVDAAAIPFNAKEKRYATPAEKFAAMQVIVEHYNSGAEAWAPKRAERVGSDELLLTQALAAAYPEKDADYVRGKVAGWTRAERLAMMDHPTIKPHVERLRAEQTKAASVDADKLLEGF